MKPEDVNEPTDFDLYIGFSTLAKVLGADDQKRKDALSSLLVDFAGDENGPEDTENNIVEEGGKRFIRWAVIWAASEFTEAGTNPAADRIFDNRVELDKLALPLEEAIASEAAEDTKPARSGRGSGGRSGGRGAAANKDAGKEQADNLKDALAGLPEGDDQTVAAEPPSTGRRSRRTTEEKNQGKDDTKPENKPAGRRRAATTTKPEEEENGDLPSRTEDAVRRMQAEVDSSVPMTTRAFLEIELAVTEHRAALYRKALQDLVD